MYSRYSGQIPPDAQIPGNYSGNALRQQNRSPADPPDATGQTPEKGVVRQESSFSARSADIPGFYRQAPRPSPEQNRNPHVSYSPLAGALGHKSPLSPISDTTVPEPEDIKRKEEQRKEKSPERVPESDTDGKPDPRQKPEDEESCHLCRENSNHKDGSGGFRWFPDGDDLLLLGLLILLLQSKGNEELALMIAMLLIVH